MAKKKAAQPKAPAVLNMAELSKNIGETLLSDSTYAHVPDLLPCMIPAIDSLTGGGLPFGRIIEIAGGNSAGKSHLVMAYIKVAIKFNVIPVVFDTEGTFDRTRLEEVGVDPSRVIIVEPDSDNPEEVTVEFIATKIVELAKVFKKAYPFNRVVFIWDSVAQTQAKYQADNDVDKGQVATQARAISAALRKVQPILTSYKFMLVATNQVRDKVGSMVPGQLDTVGGHAWKHNASMRIFLKKAQAYKVGTTNLGYDVRVQIIKSKVGESNKEVKAYVSFLDGYGLEDNIMRDALATKILGTTGQSYVYESDEGVEYKAATKNFLNLIKETPDLYRELYKKLFLHHFPSGFPAFANELLVFDSETFPELAPFIDGTDVQPVEQTE